MNFTREANIDGTSFQGSVQISYDKLVQAFGEPENVGEHSDKVRFEWDLTFADGTVAAIYDWKQYGTPAGFIEEWNIGGKSHRAVELVLEHLRPDCQAPEFNEADPSLL